MSWARTRLTLKKRSSLRLFLVMYVFGEVELLADGGDAICICYAISAQIRFLGCNGVHNKFSHNLRKWGILMRLTMQNEELK
jgi:hypothetical protein